MKKKRSFEDGKKLENVSDKETKIKFVLIVMMKSKYPSVNYNNAEYDKPIITQYEIR